MWIFFLSWCKVMLGVENMQAGGEGASLLTQFIQAYIAAELWVQPPSPLHRGELISGQWRRFLWQCLRWRLIVGMGTFLLRFCLVLWMTAINTLFFNHTVPWMRAELACSAWFHWGQGEPSDWGVLLKFDGFYVRSWPVIWGELRNR